MIAEKDRQLIKDLARKHSISRVLLFGSSISEQEQDSARDIDIAIEGIEDGDFYAFYGDVTIALSKPVDVVDISRPSKFSELIRKEGVDLYA